MAIFRNCLPFWSKECHPMYQICKTFSCWSLNCSFSLLFRCLDKLNGYCIKWSLIVNIAKTKIIVFNKSGKVLKDTIYYDNDVLVNSNEHNYLGVIFNPPCSFSSAIDHLCRKARKAIFRIRIMFFFSDKMNISYFHWCFETSNMILVSCH
jgi:hypothetical protein